jgi:glucokinase
MISLSHQLLHDRPLFAVGVSFGGPVDFSAGRVRLSHHVPGWENLPLRDLLQNALKVPVLVENDANVAALGEWRFGAGAGCASMLYVTVSTGVGGGWILENKIFRGVDGMAGEIGHTVIQPDGPVCTCGKRGCVEALASGLSIARMAREILAAETEGGTLLRSFERDSSLITAEHVSRAAEAGDQLAQRILCNAAEALGQGIGIALALVNPQKVIIGGGVAKSGSIYWQALRERARKLVLPGVNVEIIPASLGDDAPLWGAVALVESLLPDNQTN